ncbi:unnamed protein product [Paramecium octaurelia]|uniref:Uncharacterized protein n=1 Tax=Paramecium octaurelia TaxID=43137 RepID=A0A8S1WCV3_PAROT|nr:unnamed protein product [Paramecium octaurelia]
MSLQEATIMVGAGNRIGGQIVNEIYHQQKNKIGKYLMKQAMNKIKEVMQFRMAQKIRLRIAMKIEKNKMNISKNLVSTSN